MTFGRGTLVSVFIEAQIKIRETYLNILTFGLHFSTILMISTLTVCVNCSLLIHNKCKCYILVLASDKNRVCQTCCKWIYIV